MDGPPPVLGIILGIGGLLPEACEATCDDESGWSRRLSRPTLPLAGGCTRFDPSSCRRESLAGRPFPPLLALRERLLGLASGSFSGSLPPGLLLGGVGVRGTVFFGSSSISFTHCSTSFVLPSTLWTFAEGKGFSRRLLHTNIGLARSRSIVDSRSSILVPHRLSSIFTSLRSSSFSSGVRGRSTLG